ncbi:MAG: DUF1003 domain-containing protein [Candidatus Woesearchaeota archaeon]|nr:DUF1003 domain-containing protein [Candidatus Woesearchaeota archaeon]
MINRKKFVPYRHRLTKGQKFVDVVTKFGGSWYFIISILVFMFSWMALNTIVFIEQLKMGNFDPYPFIFLNLVLGVLVTIEAPIILMSQNRQEERDRIRAVEDYRINKKAELEIEDIQKDLEEIKRLVRKRK